jgi:hypothetical protein
MTEPIPLKDHPRDCGCSVCVTHDALEWLANARRFAPPSRAKTQFDPRKLKW